MSGPGTGAVAPLAIAITAANTGATNATNAAAKWGNQAQILTDALVPIMLQQPPPSSETAWTAWDNSVKELSQKLEWCLACQAESTNTALAFTAISTALAAVSAWASADTL